MTYTGIASPKTYAEWSEVLEMFKKKQDDESVLAAMQSGTLEWQSGVAERFAAKLIGAVNTRMNNATDKFQKDISRANGQDRVIVQALLALRKEMAFLAQAVNLRVIPEKDRVHYRQLVISQAASIQTSLEDSAKKDRTGKLASLIRNNRVDAF